MLVGASLALLCLTSACGSQKCVGNLAQVGAGCPATFDGKLESFPACPEHYSTQTAFRCDDLIVLTYSSLSGYSCYFDFGSHQLVGAATWTDVPTYCGDSFTRAAGRTPSDSCPGTVDRVERFCTASAVDAGP
jgi:hypothetical protein